MAHEKLYNCQCLEKLDKDMISESLSTNLHIVRDLLRDAKIKTTPDLEFIERLENQQALIEDIKNKVDKTPLCK